MAVNAQAAHAGYDLASMAGTRARAARHASLAEMAECSQEHLDDLWGLFSDLKSAAKGVYT